MPTLTETPMETLNRDDLVSMALATNKSAPSIEEDSSISSKIEAGSRDLINLDKTYGVKMQGQYIEAEFKYQGGGFTGVKSRKFQKKDN